jgi:hypothetical protein
VDSNSKYRILNNLTTAGCSKTITKGCFVTKFHKQYWEFESILPRHSVAKGERAVGGSLQATLRNAARLSLRKSGRNQQPPGCMSRQLEIHMQPGGCVWLQTPIEL